MYTLSAKIRFPFQFIAVFLVLYQVGVPLSPLYLSLLSVLYVIIGIGTINMFNFMDGINGITGIYSLAVLSGLFFINANEHLVHDDLIIFPAISLLIFGFYNFRKKALFFAGDIGSIAIGVLIFFIGFLFTIKLSSPLILFVVIAVFMLLYISIFKKLKVAK
jgi:UDP-N-acetylmuramyl pentapeptide phosphotransferase/UDP-N-acetylglucosamine-1-phosphate transferase